MGKYYKLYLLEHGNLISKFKPDTVIQINKKYYSSTENTKICFAPLDHILDYYPDFGFIVCDVTPDGNVVDGIGDKVQSMCRGIIPSNPRSIFSPSFIKELIETGTISEPTDECNNSIPEKDSFWEVWRFITSLDCIQGVLEHFKECDRYAFDPAESLKMLLIDEYPLNLNLNGWFADSRKMHNYLNLYKESKKKGLNIDAKKIIIDAWNKYSPCFKSKFLKNKYKLFRIL